MESFDRLILLAIEDITGRKRAESITQARLRMLSMASSPSGSRDETLQMMLDEIEKQTGSTIGFYHFLNVDQETLSLQAWSTNTLRDMCSAEGKGSHYNISQAGVWVDCVRQRGPVIHNDYVSLANRKGLPPGHAAVKREMVVPVLRDGRIVAIIGVGNKPTDYNATDVEIAESLGQLSWEIFERIRAVDELQAAYAEVKCRARELELSYKDMESFSYSISHDLRAPLRIIKGMADIALQDHYDKLDDEGKTLLKRIHGNIEKMDQLINALLDLSRIGRLEMNVNEIDMEKEAALISADLNASAPEQNINMDIKKLPPAYGDITLIRQVLTNLLSNAVKFTKGRDVASIEIGGRSGNGENIYYVKDNGAGFKTDYADKLFGVFQRLHSAKEFEGIGIGLSIVQRIIQRHGGRVWAEGETGKGATFYFTLPTTAARGAISETSE
jgi:two-component system sensor kinase